MKNKLDTANKLGKIALAAAEGHSAAQAYTGSTQALLHNMCRGQATTHTLPMMTAHEPGWHMTDPYAAGRFPGHVNRQQEELSQMLLQLQLQQGMAGFANPLGSNGPMLQLPAHIPGSSSEALARSLADQHMPNRMGMLPHPGMQQQMHMQDSMMPKFFDQQHSRRPSEAAMNYAHQDSGWHHGQHQHHGRNNSHHRKGPAGNSINLNKQIMASSSLNELSALVHHHGHSFDFFNISSAIAKVPKLVGPTAVGCQLAPEAKLLVDALSKLMIHRLPEFDGRGLANVAWSFGKLKYVPTQAIPNLLAREALNKIDSLSPQNISNMLWSFVYMHHYNEPLLRAMATHVKGKVEQFKPQELANVLWAMASLDFNDPEMVQVAAARAVDIRVLFKEQELSNIIWALGKLQHTDLEIYTLLLQEATDKLQFFLPQGIANIAWSVAAQGVDPGAFFPRVVHMHGHNLAAFDVQALANLLWGMATCGYHNEAFLRAALQEGSRRLDRMAPQHLCNLLWSWAALGGCRDAAMLASWAQHAMQKADTFEPQGLANAAWAFAKLGYHDSSLYEALADAASFRVEELNAQGLCNVAWALATAGYYQPQLATKLAQQALLELSQMSPHQCATLAWSFSTAGHYSPHLMDALLLRTAQMTSALGPQDLSDLLWAAAHVGHGLGAAADMLVARACELAPMMAPRQLVDTFWALAVLGLLDHTRFMELSTLLSAMPGLTLELKQRAFHAQLMFWSWLARAVSLPFSQLKPELLPSLPEPLHSQARAVWSAATQSSGVSVFQSEVCKALASVGVDSSVARPTEDGLLLADVSFMLEGHRVALEAESAGSFTANPPHLPLSDVLIRRTLLQDRGWHVVNLSQQDWQMMGSTLAERGAALLQLVASSLRPDAWTPPASKPPGIKSTSTPSDMDALSNLLACLNGASVPGMSQDQQMLVQALQLKQQQDAMLQQATAAAFAQLDSQSAASSSYNSRQNATQAWVNHLNLGSTPGSSTSSPACSRPESTMLGAVGALGSVTVSSLGSGAAAAGPSTEAAPVVAQKVAPRPTSQGSHRSGSGMSSPASHTSSNGRMGSGSVFSGPGELLSQLEGTLAGGAQLSLCGQSSQ